MKAKELSLLFLADLLVGFCKGFKVFLQPPLHWIILPIGVIGADLFKVYFQPPLHRVILMVGADSPGTELKFLCVWDPSGYHDTTVHLGRIQSPVGDANKGHMLLSVDGLVTRNQGENGPLFTVRDSSIDLSKLVMMSAFTTKPLGPLQRRSS